MPNRATTARTCCSADGPPSSTPSSAAPQPPSASATATISAAGDRRRSTAAEYPPDMARDPLLDGHGRRIADLRVSVTDRCNFRCQYCMPAEGLPWLERSEVLSFEE